MPRRATPSPLIIPLPPDSVAADPEDYPYGSLARLIAQIFQPGDPPVRLDREPAIDDLFEERESSTGLTFFRGTLRPGHTIADLRDPRILVAGDEAARALRIAQARHYSAAELRRQRHEERTSRRLQLHAALVASPETPVSGADVAFALSLREGDVRRAAPPLTIIGRKRVAPFRAWLAALDLEVPDGHAKEQAEAGGGRPGTPDRKSVV